MLVRIFAGEYPRYEIIRFTSGYQEGDANRVQISLRSTSYSRTSGGVGSLRILITVGIYPMGVRGRSEQ